MQQVLNSRTACPESDPELWRGLAVGLVAAGIGALYTFTFIPNALEPSYDGDPDGAMVFLRLKASS